MEENTAAVECLILFYINTKHVLKTKQLDERVFLDQMMRHCRENGFHAYSNEEIRNTWKNITLKYVELKKTGTIDAKESWKYYEILDSCYEQSDFHNGVYPKFSEEMVWFLIECFLKRKGLEKTQKKNSMLHEIHKDFLQSGYLYITKQDIENKWKYLNLKYDKLKEDPETLKKLPYLHALTAFREKDKCLVKMIFTRELTEILIERFTDQKITCVIHGYDSEQVLSEIQSQLRDLGFDFSQEEIKTKWNQMTNVYTFLLSKGKHDSSWIYYNAMKEHFKDDFLFGFRKIETEVNEDNKPKPPLRQRSKSVGADARIRYNTDRGSAKLIVNIEQLNEEKLSPTSPGKLPENKRKRASKRKSSPKKIAEKTEDALYISPKKLKLMSKSKENSKKNKKRTDTKAENIKNKFSRSLFQKGDSITVKKGNQLKKLTIDRNGNQERRSSMDIGSPGSKVHIINIDESTIDKKSGNLTINLPSITKQFSDNEFLPLKKRLRVEGDNTDKHLDEKKEIKDGFLGFPREDEGRRRSKSEENENKRLTEEEMADIMQRISHDKSDKYGVTSNVYSKNQNYYKPDGINYNYNQEPYNSFNQPCLLIPKEEQQDNLPVENYNPNAVTPPPVLLLVIKVDGSNNPLRDSDVTEGKKQTRNKMNDKKDPKQSNDVSNISPKRDNFVKPVTPKSKTCTVTQIEPVVNREQKSKEVIDSRSRSFNSNLSTSGSKIKKCTTIQNKNVTAIQSTEVQSNDGTNIPIKRNTSVKLNNTKSKSCPITLNDDKIVIVESPEEKNKDLHNGQNIVGKTSNTETAIPLQNLSSPEKVNRKSDEMETISLPTVEKNITISTTQQQTNIPKKIRLPVKGGGNVKEIFISPRELSKLAKIKPGDFKVNTSPTKQTNDDSLAKNTAEVNTAPYKTPPKFKFISHVIKPPSVINSSENKSEKVPPKVKSKVNSPIEPVTEAPNMLPPPTAIAASTKFLGTNSSSNISSKSLKNEDFENESVFSEAVGDDDCLKDNLLATVIDFQEQNNQEFVEIKNLMKQNNLLQRETNRLLRLMLEKM